MALSRRRVCAAQRRVLHQYKGTQANGQAAAYRFFLAGGGGCSSAAAAAAAPVCAVFVTTQKRRCARWVCERRKARVCVIYNTWPSERERENMLRVLRERRGMERETGLRGSFSGFSEGWGGRVEADLGGSRVSLFNFFL